MRTLGMLLLMVSGRALCASSFTLSFQEMTCCEASDQDTAHGLQRKDFAITTSRSKMILTTSTTAAAANSMIISQAALNPCFAGSCISYYNPPRHRGKNGNETQQSCLGFSKHNPRRGTVIVLFAKQKTCCVRRRLTFSPCCRSRTHPLSPDTCRRAVQTFSYRRRRRSRRCWRKICSTSSRPPPSTRN